MKANGGSGQVQQYADARRPRFARTDLVLPDEVASEEGARDLLAEIGTVTYCGQSRIVYSLARPPEKHHE